jgi:hypothetical protein
VGAIFSGFTKSVRKRCRKRKEEKSWRISVLQQHNRALPKIQAFAPSPTIQAFGCCCWLWGGGICCVGVLAVCFGLWTFLHV